MEQASCQLSPVVDNLLWSEIQILELNWCVTFCKHKNSRLNVWVMFHLYCKAAFCSPALRDSTGRCEDAAWVQRGLWAWGHMQVITTPAAESRGFHIVHLPEVYLLFSLFSFSSAGEAIHLGSLIAAQGYVFPISDHVLTLKDDGTFYRFQVGEPSAFLVALSAVCWLLQNWVATLLAKVGKGKL